MTIAKSIVKHGTEAVLEYRRMTGTEHDNHVPELFLGGWIVLLCHKLRRRPWRWQHGHRGMLRAMARAIATRTDVIELGT